MSIDLSTPDGEGKFAITAIQHKGKVMTTHMEGKVEGYGIVRLSHDYEHISPNHCNIKDTNFTSIFPRSVGFISPHDSLKAPANTADTPSWWRS